MLWTALFWKGLAERAIKTFFQALVAAIGVAATLGDVNWLPIISTAGLAALLSAATSVGNADFAAGTKVDE